MAASDVMEFGFDDAKVVKPQGFEKFKQDRPGRVDRISIIAFKTYFDTILAQKARDKGAPLTDEEKGEFGSKLELRLAEQLKKKPEDLTEVDRLDIRQPKFWVAHIHFQDGIGTIRCQGKWEGDNLVTAGICCKHMGDAEQSIGTVILRYPTDENHQVDPELLQKKKLTEIAIYKLSSKKYKKVESVYIEARNHQFGGEPLKTIDVKVTLDGDPKYQKQNFEGGSVAYWARSDVDPELRRWVLEQGLRASKYVSKELGYDMPAEKLAERLNIGPLPGTAASAALHASSAAPIAQDYSKLLD